MVALNSVLEIRCAKDDASVVPPSIKRFCGMKSDPWLIIIGMDSGGFEKLSKDAKHHIISARYIIGPARHLSMLPDCDADLAEWPVPFSDGVEMVLSRRGQPSVMLTSGDPFWFGAGTQITSHLASEEWLAYPSNSCFSICAAELGWALEKTLCIELEVFLWVCQMELILKLR